MASSIDILQNVTTGTITTMLLKKGIRHSWMAGAMPFGFSGKRVVGPAFTLRFVPVREDLATPESWSKPISTRGAIEAMPEKCVVVADAMGVTGAGIFGDILCMQFNAKVDESGTFKFTWTDDDGTITTAEEKITVS